MSIHRNREVRPLNEELAEIGLDPEATISQIQRTTSLISRRMDGNNGGGAPGYARPPQPSQGREGLQEVSGSPRESTGDDDLEEALKVVKRVRKTAAEKLASKRSRKKRKGKLRRAAKMYYKKAKRKIAKLRKFKLKKFGKAGLQKLARAGKRILGMSSDEVANMREDLNTGGMADSSNPYEEAAFSAGLLAMYLGEIFEAAGDTESSETMYDVSDAAAGLSESWATLGEEDELDEDQEAQLERVLESTIKALRVYEGMGAPSLYDVIEATEADAEAA